MVMPAPVCEPSPAGAAARPMRLSVLGATGSIGGSTLDLVARNPARYEVVALTAQCNAPKLAQLAIAHKAKLASEYLEFSLALYRQTREEAKRLLNEVKEAGYSSVFIQGEGEIAEIVRLTCLELKIDMQLPDNVQLPIIEIEQANLQLRLPDSITAG